MPCLIYEQWWSDTALSRIMYESVCVLVLFSQFCKYTASLCVSYLGLWMPVAVVSVSSVCGRENISSLELTLLKL